MSDSPALSTYGFGMRQATSVGLSSLSRSGWERVCAHAVHPPSACVMGEGVANTLSKPETSRFSQLSQPRCMPQIVPAACSGWVYGEGAVSSGELMAVVLVGCLLVASAVLREVSLRTRPVRSKPALCPECGQRGDHKLWCPER